MMDSGTESLHGTLSELSYPAGMDGGASYMSAMNSYALSTMDTSDLAAMDTLTRSMADVTTDSSQQILQVTNLLGNNHYTAVYLQVR